MCMSQEKQDPILINNLFPKSKLSKIFINLKLFFKIKMIKLVFEVKMSLRVKFEK